MEEYLVCEWSMVYGIELVKARRFTEEEKKKYEKWYQELGFVGLDKSIKLDEINTQDLSDILNRPLGKSDGSFYGSSNQAYIISQEQWDRLISINTDRVNEKEKEHKIERINYYKSIISACEKATKLYTDDEAKQARINYCNAVNEGGEGFMPHFYTFSEYENAKKQLEILENE